jgi:hypothetical protein
MPHRDPLDLVLAADRVSKSLALVPLALAFALADTASAAPRAGDDRDDPHEHVVVVVEEDHHHHDHDDDDIDGARGSRLRMHFDTQVVGGAAFDPEGEEDTTVSLGAGLPRPAILEDRAGLSRPLLGFGLGWVVGERAVLGAKLALTVDAFGLEDDDPAVFVGGRFIPYFHWMFLPGALARPYMEVRAGIGGASSFADAAAGGRVRNHVIYPLVGAGLGVHLFPHDRFSLDLGLDADYLAPFVRTTYSDPAREDRAWDKRGDMLAFGALLGFSAWF